MASSDNLTSFETWAAFRPSFETPWLSESYARDNDTLTRALHHSLTSSLPTTTLDPPPSKPETPSFQSGSSSGGVSETETVSKRSSAAALPPKGGKVVKRRSRASKRSPTTFINANPENFRQMVQQVTGVRFNPDSQLPAGSVVRPEPQKGGSAVGMLSRLQAGCLLPTLDTSAFLLDHHQHVTAPEAQQTAAGFGTAAVVAEGGGGANGFEFEGFSCFPTLDSWKVM